MFDDYQYTPGEDSAPQVGTTESGGFDWDGFINNTVRGATEIIKVSRTPANTLPNYRGSGTTAAGSQTGAVASSDMLGLAVVGLLLFLLLR